MTALHATRLMNSRQSAEPTLVRISAAGTAVSFLGLALAFLNPSLTNQFSPIEVVGSVLALSLVAASVHRTITRWLLSASTQRARAADQEFYLQLVAAVSERYAIDLGVASTTRPLSSGLVAKALDEETTVKRNTLRFVQRDLQEFSAKLQVVASDLNRQRFAHERH